MDRSVVWQLIPSFGAELACVKLGDGSLVANGTAIRAEPFPYRVSYDLRTGPSDYVTTRLDVRVDGAGWHRHLTLKRAAGHGGDSPWGAWYEHGGDEPMNPVTPPDRHTFAEALDCDLGLSPLTNTLPVLRHRLHEQPGSVRLVLAWVSIPDLQVRAVTATYTHVRPGIVRYEAPHITADIEFDDLGLVTNYPALATRVV